MQASKTANMVNNKGYKSNDTPQAADNVEEEDELENCGFFADMEVAYNVDNSPSPPPMELIYDSGATKSIMCNFGLLMNPKRCEQPMNTYRGQITVTHVGTLSLGPISIFPVYFAPNGPRNLVSASQLKDHGLKVIHQH